MKIKLIKRITEERTRKGITQAELARKVGTQPSNISRLESGKSNPTLDLLLRVAKALNLILELRSNRPMMVYEPEQSPLYNMDLESIYEIRCYDRPIVTFRYEKVPLEGLVTRLLSVDHTVEKIMPMDLELTDEGILKWLERRVIPQNRTFVEEILKSLGLSEKDTRGIIDISLGLSLNDSYWVVPSDFDGLYADYNLYENPFSDTLSLIAFTGAGDSEKGLITSPELTTGGMLPKAWRTMDGDGIYLYKGGTSGFANTGMEPYSEYYASQIAEAMGLKSVRYDLEKWEGILASKCKIFTDIDTSYVPIGRAVKTGGLTACLEWLTDIDENLAEKMRSMLVFDALIYNEDRHFGNFGVLRDNISGVILDFAPLFDHGLSLFNFAMKKDFDNLDEYAKTRGPAYKNLTFEGICADVMGKTQRTQLRTVFNFKFTPHESYNWEDYRIEAIEKHIQKRATRLIQL